MLHGSRCGLRTADTKTGGAGLSVRAIQTELSGEHARDTIRAAIKQAIKPN